MSTATKTIETVADALKMEGVTEAGFEVYATFKDANSSNTRSISPTFDTRADAFTYLEKLQDEVGAAMPDNARVILWKAF